MSMFIMTFVVLGLYSFTDLAIDLFPKVDFPFITVRTIYRGSGPAEIENLITKHIEEEVSAINGIKNITSTSIEGVSVVAIEFEIGTDIDVAAADVKDKVELAKARLPLEAEDPVILKFDMGAQPVMDLAISSPRPLDELFELTEDNIKPELMKIPGLASINILGGKEREIRVELNQERMKSQNVSILDVIKGLNLENLNVPSGHITEKRKEYSIRVSGEFETVDDIRDIVIQAPSNRKVRLRDIGTVVDDFKEQRQLARYNGISAIGVSLIKRSDANIVEVTDLVKENLEAIKSLLPDDIDIRIASDNSNFIRNSISEVVNNMGIGIILTAVILFLFLHTWQGTVIAAISMPTAIIATFILIRFAGFTINFMTLLGLAVTVGVLVTNSIVVLENIYRHSTLDKDINEACIKGTDEITTAVLASTLTNIVVFTPIAFMGGIVGQFFYQFGLTVAFATLFSLIVSLTLTPMLASKLLAVKKKKSYGFDVFALGVLVFVLGAVILGISIMAGTFLSQSVGTWGMIAALLTGIGIAGYAGKLIMDASIVELKANIVYRVWLFMIKAAVFGLVGGIVYGILWYLFGTLTAMALTLFVVLILLLDRLFGILGKFARVWDSFYDKLSRDYKESLDWALRHKGIVVMTVLAVFSVSLYLGRYIGSEFITQSDQGYIGVSIELPPGSNFDQTNKTLLRIESELENIEEIESFYTILGQAPGTFIGRSEGVQYGEILVQLVPKEDRIAQTGEVLEKIKRRLVKVPMADITIKERENSGGGDSGNPLQIEITGEELDVLNRIADEVLIIAKNTPGAVDIRSTWREGVPEVHVIPDRKKMADYGITLATLASVIRSSIDGNIATQYRIGNKEYDIRVRLDRNYVQFADQIKNILVKKDDLYIPLSELTYLRQFEGPTSITRKNKKRLVTVTGNFVNRSAGDVVAEIAEGIENIQMPPGYQVHFGGDAEFQEDSFAELIKALLLAVILAYIVLAAIMESFVNPLIIMMTLPLAFIGVILSLVITGKTISIISLMAIVMLVGIVVNNAILLIDYMQNLRKQGKNLTESILEGASVRLRPILMTNIATAMSMLPLALELGEGAEMRSPMAVVAIGALITSTILTLYIIPILYNVFENIKAKRFA